MRQAQQQSPGALAISVSKHGSASLNGSGGSLGKQRGAAPGAPAADGGEAATPMSSALSPKGAGRLLPKILSPTTGSARPARSRSFDNGTKQAAAAAAAAQAAAPQAPQQPRGAMLLKSESRRLSTGSLLPPLANAAGGKPGAADSVTELKMLRLTTFQRREVEEQVQRSIA